MYLHRARLGGQLEVGYGSGGDVSNSRPADFLVPNLTLGKPAAFDLTVVSPLNSNTLIEAGATSGSAAGKAEVRKHNANDPKCRELGWVCIPLAVESYGCWGGGGGGRSTQFVFSPCSPPGFAVTVQQVQSHNDHIPET